MKTIQKIIIFILTFLIGLILSTSIETSTKDVTHRTVYAIETKQVEKQVDFEEVIETKAKTEEKEKQEVFEVEGFWDESTKNMDKYFLEWGFDSYSDDLEVKSGETWLGLFGKNGKYVLRPTKMNVSTEKSEEFFWKNISINTNTEPLFLVKELKSLKKGKVTTLFHNFSWKENENDETETTSLYKDFVKEFKIGEDLYTLRVKQGINEKQEPILVLLLDNGKTSQIIYYVYYSPNNYVGSLYWVGDLDSDGKLDLFMDYYNYEKCNYSSGLFLSSEADEGKLVKEFRFSGIVL